MLNEAEQRRLVEIESSLRAEDPAFTRQFELTTRRRSRLTRFGIAALAIIVLSIAGGVAGILIHSVAAVVAAATTLGATIGGWITRRVSG